MEASGILAFTPPPDGLSNSTSKSNCGSAFQLDDISLRVAHTDGGTFTVSDVSISFRQHRHTMAAAMRSYCLSAERLHRKSEMVEIAAVGARRPASRGTEHPVHGDQIDQGPVGSKLLQADPAGGPLRRAEDVPNQRRQQRGQCARWIEIRVENSDRPSATARVVNQGSQQLHESRGI